MVDVFDRHEVRFDPRLAGCSTFVRHSDYAALEAQLAEAKKALELALEYWADRQQRYKNLAPAWVVVACRALTEGKVE